MGIRELMSSGGVRESELTKATSIVKALNLEVAKLLAEGHEVELPHKMGTLRIRKFPHKPTPGKRVYRNVDWGRTLQWWAEDAEAKAHKRLLYQENKELYKIAWEPDMSSSHNMRYYQFRPCRSFKRELSRNIKEYGLNIAEEV